MHGFEFCVIADKYCFIEEFQIAFPAFQIKMIMDKPGYEQEKIKGGIYFKSSPEEKPAGCKGSGGFEFFEYQSGDQESAQYKEKIDAYPTPCLDDKQKPFGQAVAGYEHVSKKDQKDCNRSQKI